MATAPIDHRTERLLETLEQMAGGDLDLRIPISPAHDHLDAAAQGINMLVGELQYASGKLRRAKDEADAANRAKTAFVRNMSHEVRTPLAAVLSTTRLLMMPELPPERREELHERILSNGAALLSLVDDLLDFSKLDEDRLVVDMHPFSLIKAAGDVTTDLESEAQKRGIALIMEPADRSVREVFADVKRVRQVLTNVIGNAIKFTDGGEVRVHLVSDGLDQVCVDVSDSGIGLTAAQASALFQPFTQADASIGKRFGGSGIGLALSRRLARSMGGDLRLRHSVLGEGATFRLSLRAWQGTDAQRPTPSAQPPVAPPGLQGIRLLLVEDDPNIREAMGELLDRLGAQTACVEDGLAALERCSKEPFDILLMDVRLPRMDGLEVTRRLRKSGLRTPIVAITADAVREHRSECLAAGCDAYLTKPVAFDQLVETIRQLCGPSPASRRSSDDAGGDSSRTCHS